MKKISMSDLRKFDVGSCFLVESEHVATVKGREIMVKASKSRGNISDISINEDGVITIFLEWIITKHGLWGNWKLENHDSPIKINLEPNSWEREEHGLRIHCKNESVILMESRIPKPRD